MYIYVTIGHVNNVQPKHACMHIYFYRALRANDKDKSVLLYKHQHDLIDSEVRCG